MLDLQTMAARHDATRQAFVDAVQAAGFSMAFHQHPMRGPTGGVIGTDVAVAGPAGAEELIFITSGLHGIEGYLGSEQQTRLLREGVLAPALADRRVVLVHAVNPYGFAWHRRVNEDNIDLNRNFIDFLRPLPVNDGYEEFKEILNPRVWNDDHVRELEAAAREAGQRLGPFQMFKAVSGGQYAYPGGMQYGGAGRAWSRVQIEEIWAAAMQGRSRAVHVDFHTGLGRRGQGLIMTYGAEDQPRIQRARRMWGDIALSPPADGPAILSTGTMGPRLEGMFPQAEVLSVGLEFGTLAGDKVSRAMAADNWLHQFGDLDSPQGRQIKQDMLDAFYIDAPDFHDMVWERSRAVVAAI